MYDVGASSWYWLEIKYFIVSKVIILALSRCGSLQDGALVYYSTQH